jgi:hypothetical protein
MQSRFITECGMCGSQYHDLGEKYSYLDKTKELLWGLGWRHDITDI